jgi:hypothetical protein
MKKAQNMSHRLPTIPVRVVKVSAVAGGWGLEWRVSPEGSDFAFDCTRRRHGFDLPDEIDAALVRESFFDIRDENDALSFLQQTGIFSTVSIREYPPPKGWLRLSDIRWWQNWLKDVSVWSLAEWKKWSEDNPRLDYLLSSHPSVGLYFSEKIPVGVVRCDTSLETILSLIKIEKVCGSEYRHCARKDCPEIYLITSGHERLYCSTDCAHLVAVRNSRNKKAKRKK